MSSLVNLGHVQALAKSLKLNDMYLLGADYEPMLPNAAAAAAAATGGTPGDRSGSAGELDILEPNEANKRHTRSHIDAESPGRDPDPLRSQPLLNEREVFLEMCQVKTLV